jgi:hypothetical protein
MDDEDLPIRAAGGFRPTLDQQKAAILSVGMAMKAAGYRFMAPTPLTYRRVLNRPRPTFGDPLLEVFGWNRPFRIEQLEQPYRELLFQGGLVQATGPGEHHSLIRFSTLGGQLFVHSGFPAKEPDSVFFGPDTYRFARAIQWLSDRETGFSPRTIIDVGTGTGAAGIFAASLFPGHGRILLTDINRTAVTFAGINAMLNDTIVEPRHSDVLVDVDAKGDLIVSNPPYLVDTGRRVYRHGGGDWGCLLAVRIMDEALSQLTPCGHLLLYTGTPVVQGVDMFLQAALPRLTARVKDFRYEEQDPDVFGEELENPPYDRADRIATVVLHVKGTNVIR